MFISPYDGFRKVKDGNFAFYCQKSTAISVILKLFEPYEICDTKEIEFRQNPPAAIIVKKLSPLRERLLINWLWMNEIGITHKIIRHWNGILPSCESNGYFQSVRFEYVASIFILLIFAHILSFIICILECFKYEMKKCVYSK